MQEQSQISRVKQIFKHVSIETFVKYYDVFRENKDFRSNAAIIDVFQKNNENWGEKSQRTRASKGKSIFRHNLEITALKYIIYHAQKTSNEASGKAKKILAGLSPGD